jgi:glycosyltransferase involved in cell wall biosynthesis
MKIAMLVPDNRDEFRKYSDPEPLFGPAPTALLKGFARMPGCEIHVICCLHKPLRSPTQISDNIFYHSSVVPRLGWRPGAYAGCVLAIRQKLRKIKPDIVHGQGTERYCALAAALSGFPNVVTIHGNMVGMARFSKAKIGSFYWCAALFESFALKRTAGVFCNSAYTEGLVRSRTQKTWRVPNALRTSFFQPLLHRKRNAEPILLNIGTIASHKRQIEILETARRLFRAGYHFQLQFIGRLSAADSYGSKFKEMIAIAERDGFAGYVEPKSDKELLQRFDAADALIHFPFEEAFGLVVAESLARNLKFFGARVGGVPDIAAGVELAELYDSDDWEGLFHGLTCWIDGGCARPRSAAHEMEKRYHPEMVAGRHIEIYEEVLTENNTLRSGNSSPLNV